MGYYGASVYRGDYYGQGDYYHNPRGDPGFFDFLSDVGSALVNPLSKIPVIGPYAQQAFGVEGFKTGLDVISGKISPATALGRVLSAGAPIQTPPISGIHPPPVWAAAAPGTGSTVAMIPAVPQSFTGLTIGGPSGLTLGKRTPMPGGSKVLSAVPPMLKRPHLAGAHHRRMNALNPRALSRALRRANSFKKYATKVLKLVGEKRHVDGFKKHRKRR